MYPVPEHEIHRNMLRVAEGWMDDYKNIVKIALPKLPEDNPLGSVEEALNLRKRLRCKSFQWYLELWLDSGQVLHRLLLFSILTLNEDLNGNSCIFYVPLHSGKCLSF